jgi:hypothetical protein
VLKRLGRPNVVAIEGDVLPAERSDVGKQKIADNLALRTKFGDGTPKVDGVPEYNGRHGEIEPGRPVSLVLERPVADFTKPMKEHGPGRVHYVPRLC